MMAMAGGLAKASATGLIPSAAASSGVALPQPVPGMTLPGQLPPPSGAAGTGLQTADPKLDVPDGAHSADDCPPSNYVFDGAEDAIQLFISTTHIGILLLGGAALVGGCIGMRMAGKSKPRDDDSDSD
jgi:hypothetical protein